MELWDVENSICPDCGQSIDLHADPDKLWYPQRLIDYAAMELAAARAMYAALHDDLSYHDGSFRAWSKERSPAYPYHYDDGVRIVLAETDVRPWDHFTTDVNADPSSPESD